MRKLSKQSRDDEETGQSSADEDDLLVINDEDDDDDELVRGSSMHVVVKVVEAYDLPPALCNYVFCQYKFWNDDNTIVVPPINASISNPGPKTNTMIFEHKQVGLNIISRAFELYFCVCYLRTSLEHYEKKMQFTRICVMFGLLHVIVSANQKSRQNL